MKPRECKRKRNSQKKLTDDLRNMPCRDELKSEEPKINKNGKMKGRPVANTECFRAECLRDGNRNPMTQVNNDVTQLNVKRILIRILLLGSLTASSLYLCERAQYVRTDFIISFCV